MSETNIKVTRTINNSLIVGNTFNSGDKVTIQDPFAMIPMEEGLRLIPLDIDLIGIRMEEIELTNDKVFYTSKLSPVIVKEYSRLLEEAKNPKEPEVQTEPEQETK